jgi:hypothetical protein
VKPEDWLSDYVTAVDIAGGNKRTAVRYAPLMLTGSAWTWLNSLPTLQINSWHDFQEAFIKNITGTYKRPPRPRQLALCKQGPDETDHDYSRDGQSCATHAKEWARSKPLATSRTDVEKEPC